MVVFAWLLEIGCTAPSEGDGPGATDDAGTISDDSDPRDDTGTSSDDSGVTDDTSTGDDTGTDDTAASESFDVELTLFQTMVNQARADITLGRPHALRVTCEAPTSDPWPERIVVRGGNSRRKHSVFLGALLAETTYTCTAEDEGHILGTFDVTTGPLPPEIDFVKPTVEFDDPTAFEPGWTLYNPTQQDLSSGAPIAGANIVVDPLGRIRWYKDAGDYDGHAMFEFDVASQEFYAGGGVLDVEPITAWDYEGNVLLEWKGIVPDHDLEKVGESYYMLTRGDDGGGGNHCLEQYDTEKSLVWSWCTDEDERIPDAPANSLAVQVTPKGTFLYATMQVRGIVYKLNRDTREVEWVFSEGGDFAGDVPYAPWMHDLQVIDCPGYTECLLVYVNGTEKDPTTRIRQIGIDEVTMTAAVVREWTEEGWQEPRLGGIHPIRDHWLICQGHFLAEPLNERRSQLVEVAPDDSVVWRLTAGSDDIQMYRARRVAACDLFHHAGYCPSVGD